MVCSVVVVVVAGVTGRTVVSSVVVVVDADRGSSEAQPENAPRKEASRQGSKSFFIILILLTDAVRLLLRASARHATRLTLFCWWFNPNGISAIFRDWGDSCPCYRRPSSWMKLRKWKNAFRRRRNRPERQAQTRQGRRRSDFLSYRFCLSWHYRRAQLKHARQLSAGLGYGFVVVVVFLTTTLVATILVPS